MGPNAYYYLVPLGAHPSVSRLWIVRPSPITRGPIQNAEFILLPTRFRLVRFLQMLWHALRLGRRKEVAGFVSFNPIPYGLIQLVAATIFGKPIHFGFVGSDWYRHAQSRYGRLLRPFFRRADFITATGTKMRQEMINFGLDPKRIRILPHSIDVENYPINEPRQAQYSCVFVGYLLPLKRVEDILRAFALVVQRLPGSKLCIVGDGPLRNELEALARELGIEAQVDFVGFVHQVQEFLVAAKIIVIASHREGMPFALIEGMVSGLVPVSTPVGTIEEFVIDGENGLLFPVGNPEDLAQRILMLLEDPALYDALRDEALKSRERFSFEAAREVWDAWLSRLQRDAL